MIASAAERLRDWILAATFAQGELAFEEIKHSKYSNIQNKHNVILEFMNDESSLLEDPFARVRWTLLGDGTRTLVLLNAEPD